MQSVTAGSSPVLARTEAERQLAAAAERHREAVDSMQASGRPEAGQHVAIKVHIVSFALRRAAVELIAWEPDLVREGLERPVPEPRAVARLAPAGVDPRAVAGAAAAFQAISRLHALTQRVLVDIDLDLGARWPAAPADLRDLYERLETTWLSWRQRLGPKET